MMDNETYGLVWRLKQMPGVEAEDLRSRIRQSAPEHTMTLAYRLCAFDNARMRSYRPDLATPDYAAAVEHYRRNP